MDYIIVTRRGTQVTRQKYTNLAPAIERFERLFGGKFEAAIAAHYEGSPLMPNRHAVQFVKAHSEDGMLISFRVRS